MREKRTELIAVRLTQAERAALEHLAGERTASMGSVLRWAVRTAVMGEAHAFGQEENEGGVKVGSQAATLLSQS